MLGAIAGDIIGSMYEHLALKSKRFPLFDKYSRFTDDTVMTAAVADWLLNGGELIDKYHEYFHYYPKAGYGGTFIDWCRNRDREPYNSWGNGSAMRVSPVAYAFEDIDSVLLKAEESAAVTHSHPEGIKGAQATAAAIFLARQGRTKQDIREYIERNFAYNLSDSVDEIRLTYTFDVSCQGSVPQSLIAFLEAKNYEDAVRNAVSMGGDADTMACIAGAVAEPFFGLPEHIGTEALWRLDERISAVVEAFVQKYGGSVSIVERFRS